MASSPRSPRSAEPPGGLHRPAGRRLVCLLLLAANLLVFTPVRHYAFVFDDVPYVTGNPAVTSGLTGQGVTWAFTTTYAKHWHPLTWLSHMVDCQLFGLSPGAHHLVNLLLHIANTLLLFLVIEAMTGALGRSAFVAALFALHPLHVESVAWIADRKDLLGALFWFLTLAAYLRYSRRPSFTRYVAVLGAFFLGLLAKPMLVTLPFVLFLIDIWPLGRFRQARGNAKRLVLEKAPLLTVAIASAAVTVMAASASDQGARQAPWPWKAQLANSLLSYVSYIRKTLWPHDLAVLYPYATDLPVWKAAGAAAVSLGITVYALRAWRKHPHQTVGWLWFVGTLFPVIGVVPGGPMTVADRYAYVPLIGLFVMAAWGVPQLLAGWRRQKTALLAMAAILIVAAGLAARLQLRYWKDDRTLFARALEVNRANPLTHHNVAVQLARTGQVDEAIALYREALRTDPDFAGAHVNLGALLARKGKLEEAITHYEEALRIRPGSAETLFNLAGALARLGRTDEAIARYEEGLRIDPDFARAHNNLGVLLARQGNFEAAIRHYREALRLKPDFAIVYDNLEEALALSEGCAGEEVAGTLTEAGAEGDSVSPSSP